MYSGLQDTATNLLRKFGQTISLTKTVPGESAVPGSFNPTTGIDSNEQTHKCEVLGLFVGISTKYKDKFTIQQGDSIVLVAPKGGEFIMPPAHYYPDEEVVPEQNDILDDDWTILAIEEVNPAGTVVLYKCHVRKQ